MANDLIARARQATGPVAPRKDQPALPVDPAKTSSLVARARAAVEAPPKQTLVAAAPPPPPVPRVDRVKLPMTCSARGQSYVVIAERRGSDLRFVGHELPQPGRGGTSQLPGRLSGEYRIEMNGWRCPLCQNGDAIWLCDCEAMNGAMHCHGASGGRYRCACGKHEDREFITVPKVEVRGTSVAATPEQTRTGPQRGQSQFKQVTYDR
jgi:hypothetical protein